MASKRAPHSRPLVIAQLLPDSYTRQLSLTAEVLYKVLQLYSSRHHRSHAHLHDPEAEPQPTNTELADVQTSV